MSLLVVDIGNTSTSAGLYRRDRVRGLRRMPTGETSVRVIRRMVQSAWGSRAPAGAMIASVAPHADPVWRRALAGLVDGPVDFVTCRHALGVALRYPDPASIGADRLANACGGVARYGTPLIVADFGTAVTFDVITGRGYEGGVIAPGLPLVFEYLAEKTAKLPRVQPRHTRGPWGCTTRQAMQLGAQWGYPGLAHAILRQLRKAAALRGARIVVTGGHGARVAAALDEAVIVDPTLTLYGVGRIYELNHGSPK